MDIRRISWEETIPLRHQVLWPDKKREYCHVEDDETAWHYGVFDQERIISVASVFPKDKKARLRKFATAKSYQGKGIGTAVINHIISELKQQKFTVFWCDAREEAIGFYERFGMEVEGDRFFKGHVPYFKMSLIISSTKATL